jgi:hypothetical protein
MKRIRLPVTVAVVLAAMMSLAGPAFGAASQESNCLAEANSTADPGRVGLDARFYAQNPNGGNTLGDSQSYLAHLEPSACGGRLPGEGPPGRP